MHFRPSKSGGMIVSTYSLVLYAIYMIFKK